LAQLIYGGNDRGGVTINTTNGLLASLQIVIDARFRDGQGFWLNIRGESIWLHPSIPLNLIYDDDGSPIEYSREVVHAMSNASKDFLGVGWNDSEEQSLLSRLRPIDPEWEPEAEAAAVAGS
jgi:hypothetical protein